MTQNKGSYRFSFGPWNIDEGGDPFGPPVRKTVPFADKLKRYRPLGFEGVQFHDDDAVPELDSRSAAEIKKTCVELKAQLDGEGLVAEFVAPRLWFAPETVDAAYASTNAASRKYAIERTRKAIDIAQYLGTERIVLWLAREGSHVRESRNPREAILWIRDAINDMLAYNPKVRILIEPKPNEPVDSALIPSIGHAIGLAYITSDPSRVGGLIESAHSILAGFDPSDDMAYALAHGKLWSVHLNDQNGLKFDQDRSFGAVNLRRAFNQVRVLDEAGYGAHGEFVGMDVKAVRTQKQEGDDAHLKNSITTFNRLLEKVRTVDKKIEQQCIAARDYEELDRYILGHLMGVSS